MLRHAYLWAWPAAAFLTGSAPPGAIQSGRTVEFYYLPALGLVLLGCLSSVFMRPRPAPAREPSFLPRRVLVALTLMILAAATVVRLWRVGEWPPDGMGFEETQLAARAYMGADWFHNLVVTYSPPTEHALTAYATSLSFGLLGTGFLQMRLPFIAGGIVAVFLFYAVCRKLVSWEVSLFAVALFSVSWWQIAAGRVTDEIFFPLWLELAVLWLLLDFEDTARPWVAYLLALASGLLIYEYSGYHLVAPIVGGYLLARPLLWGVRLWRQPGSAAERRRQAIQALRTYGPGALAIALVWAIIGRLQLVDDLRLGKGSWFFEAVRRHESDTNGLLAHLHAPSDLPSFILHKLTVPLRAAYQPGYGDFCRYLGIGEYPAFDRATAFAMGLGILLVAATPWRRFHVLTLLWALAVFLPAALLPENPNLHRFYVDLPLFFLCIALGAEVVWDWLRPSGVRAALLAAFAAAVLYAGAVNLHHLYWDVMANPKLTDAWRWPRTEIINWVRAHARGDWICIVADDERSVYGASPMQPEWKWAVAGWDVLISRGNAECIRAPHREPGARYYVLALADPPVDLAALLRAHYPEARELAPIQVPLHHFVARTFVVPDQPPAAPRRPRGDVPPNWDRHGHH